MDQVVAQALTLYARICGLDRAEAVMLNHEPKITTVTFDGGKTRRGVRVKARREPALTVS
jgi:hypothetical protein